MKTSILAHQEQPRCSGATLGWLLSKHEHACAEAQPGSGWPSQPTHSSERAGGRPHFLLTNIQLWFGHKLTHDSSCPCSASALKVSGGGKDKQSSKLARSEESPLCHPMALLCDLLQMSSLCKDCPYGAQQDVESYLLILKAQVRKPPENMTGEK